MSRNPAPFGGQGLPPRRPAPNSSSDALFGNRGPAGPTGYGQPQQRPGRYPQQQQPSDYGQQTSGGYGQRAPVPVSEKPRGSSSGPELQLAWAKPVDGNLLTESVYSSVVVVSDRDFQSPDGRPIYILVRSVEGVEGVVTAMPSGSIGQGQIFLSQPQREWLKVSMLPRERLTCRQWSPFDSNSQQVYAGSIDVTIGLASANQDNSQTYSADDLEKRIQNNFQNIIVQPNQRIIMEVGAVKLMVVVKTVTLINLGGSTDGATSSSDERTRGILTIGTTINIQKDHSSGIKLEGSATKANANAIIAPDFKFEDMGIGGLAGEFATIFRRAFASRIFPPAMVQKLGIQHVKGILMYGPPGTGKTLMARQIGKMLNAREPKIINGPEILNKFVGQSEENVRKMFEDAEKEYKEKGDESGLHVIIFDELDAVCKQRGSGAGGGTGVGDSVVNQLLTKLDGVDQLNNILLIGMTNRKDMIDEALLRPGRLEVQLEISLPNEEGRLQILKIHTSKMLKNDVLGSDVDLATLAAEAKNYSGAELSGLVKAATSFAFARHTKVDQMAGIKEDVANMKVTMADFQQALREVRPAYGVDEQDLDLLIPNGIMNFNEQYIQELLSMGKGAFITVRDSENRRHETVLFHGPPGSGKTALAAEVARMSGYPFVKVLSPKDLLPYRDEMSKIDFINRQFTNAYRSPLSMIIIDDFERMIEWSPIGPRYSNNLYTVLQTLIRNPPPKDHRLLIFVTTSKLHVLKLLEADQWFDEKVHVRALRSLNELAAVMETSGVFDRSEIPGLLDQIQREAYISESEQRNGEFRVDVGVKKVLHCLFEAKAVSKPVGEGGLGLQAGPRFVRAMVEAVGEAKMRDGIV